MPHHHCPAKGQVSGSIDKHLGIVLEKAIITARTHREDWTVVTQGTQDQGKDIVDCVAGIIFLGTPFKASEAQSYAKIIGNILSLVDRGSSAIYETTPQALREQRRDFVRIVNRQHIPLCCFFEQHRSNIGRVLGSPIRHYVSLPPSWSSCPVSCPDSMPRKNSPSQLSHNHTPATGIIAPHDGLFTKNLRPGAKQWLKTCGSKLW